MTIATLLALIALQRLHPSPGRKESAWAPSWLPPLVRDLVHHGPNEEDELGLLAGYYESLLNASVDVTSRADPEDDWKNSMRFDETAQERIVGFLGYQPKAGLDLITVANTHVVTNQAGLADREYPIEKPAGARRIAFVGDSLVRGLGAPFGRALEPRFEEWLNATQTTAATTSYEVLNFGVEGYRLTQLLDVALERTTPFHPDAVLLGLSDLSASRTFGNHLAWLVHEGIDLKYPFLREQAALAGVNRDDGIKEAESKLNRRRAAIVRGCLAEMSTRLRERGIALVVVLLPSVNVPERLEPRFAEVRGLLAELSIPTLDLLDSFAGAADVEALRVSRVDHHPNEAACGMLLTRLQDRLAEAPATSDLLLGHAARVAR